MKFSLILAVLLTGCAVGTSDSLESGDAGTSNAEGLLECTPLFSACQISADCCQTPSYTGIVECVQGYQGGNACMSICVVDADCCGTDNTVCRTCRRIVNEPYGVCD